MTKHAFPVSPDLEAYPDEIALGAVDVACPDFCLKQRVISIEIAELDMPSVLALRQEKPASVIEVESYAMRANLGGH